MGNVDIYHSRRTNYALCKFWIREESDQVGDLSTWILKTKPSGEFYAKELSAQAQQGNPISNAMFFDKNIITLETDDDIDEISRGCVVLYNGHSWIVNDVQKTLHRKETQFSSISHYTYTIALRR